MLIYYRSLLINKFCRQNFKKCRARKLFLTSNCSCTEEDLIIKRVCSRIHPLFSTNLPVLRDLYLFFCNTNIFITDFVKKTYIEQ